MVYWLTNTGVSSIRLQYEDARADTPAQPDVLVDDVRASFRRFR